MRRLQARALVLVLLVPLLGALLGAGYPAPTRQFYVNDFADVLSSGTEQYIMEKSPALEQQTSAQIAVVTIETLGGAEPADYARGLGREWGIGDKEENNGVLILLAPADGQIRVEVGRGLEGALNDAKVGRMIDTYALAHYKRKDFNQGTYELYNGVLSQVMTEYGLDALPGYEPERTEESAVGSIVSTAAVFIILIVLSLLFTRGGRGGGGGGGGRYYRARRGFYGGYYGGFGGNSGGSSGGFGGGGGFTGGGGGFGGGGAGRSF